MRKSLNNTTELQKKGEILISKKYDLADFRNETETLKQLADFKAFCKTNKINL